MWQYFETFFHRNPLIRDEALFLDADQVYLYQGGGRKRLPKFKFSAKFPIGLHVILQIQIIKFENDCYIMWKSILTENPSRCNLAPLLK